MIASLLDTALDRTVLGGYTNVGYAVRSRSWHDGELRRMGGKAVLVFDPGTYTLLGITTRGEQGQVGGGALLQMAITDQAGQQP